MSGNNDVGDFKLIAILDVGEKLSPQSETAIEIVTEISKLSQKTSQTPTVTNIDVVEKLNENVPIRQIKYKL